MNKAHIIKELKRLYPARPIVCIPEDKPTEIVCEVSEYFDQGVAVAIIDRSKPHLHRKTTEVYLVERGCLTIHFEKRKALLRVGDVLVIPPGIVHWAEGKEAWVKVISAPKWSANDHF